ncbi:MAG: phosphoglycerate kinase [Candidatus Microgenomates bacterium]|jgi:phosphoglycerate kinase
MTLPKPTDLDVAGKRVILRLDLDTKPDENDLRIKASKETLDFLYSQKAKIIIIAHKGRPEGKVNESLSLKPFEPLFSYWGAEVKENLRFNPGEEANDESFAHEIASWGDVYINEAFASSHRAHASIVGVPKFLPHAAGFHFIAEIENLSNVFEPKRPLVFIMSGAKEDKLSFIGEFEKFADKVLVGGKLPELLGDKALESVRTQTGKVIIGNLVMDKEDITLNTIERFEKEVDSAGMVVVSGPLGKYEDEGHRQGTERVFKAVAESGAFKIAGGGDTEAALSLLNLPEKFDWVSVGGGAMLEFLSKKNLPGIRALL